jgi:4-amino-4-deoxy-L-arabinose transferase-like glycosyltransferase
MNNLVANEATAFAASRRQGALTPMVSAVLVLIALTMIVRMLFAWTLGLGIDESYTVATGRDPQLSYFDHPPLAWWLEWAAGRLFGTEDALVLRAPFVMLFALTTWLMFALTRLLFDERAGLWAAVTLNLAPVLAWTSGTWILPDGPLNAALLAGAYSVSAALFTASASAPVWWLVAGVCGGLAMLAKLHGIFLFAGTGLFLSTSPSYRHWLATPWPYVAIIVAAVIFLPVIIWNEQHQWVSFVFQGERARPREFEIWAPPAAIAGQALFLLPWVWLPLVLCLVKAGLAGPANDRQWLMVCLAIGPIAFFTAVAWTGTHTHPHWAASGYLMLFPLLGLRVATSIRNGRHETRIWLVSAAILLAVLVSGVIALANLPWPPIRLIKGTTLENPVVDALNWDSIEPELRARHLLGRTNLFVAARRWDDAGKIDYALHGRVPVVCLGHDPRGFGIVRKPRKYLGEDALIIGRDLSYGSVQKSYGSHFQSISQLPPITIEQGGQPAFALSVYLAHKMLSVPNKPDRLGH